MTFSVLLFYAGKEYIPFKPRHLPSLSSIFESPAEPPEISCTFSYTQHGVVLMEISGRGYALAKNISIAAKCSGQPICVTSQENVALGF